MLELRVTIRMIKKFDDIFSLLDTIQERDRRTDGRTDRQTDTGRQQRRLLHKASSNKSLAPQYNCIATLLCKVRTSAILQKITFSTHLTRNDKDVTVICFGCCQFWYLLIYICEITSNLCQPVSAAQCTSTSRS